MRFTVKNSNLFQVPGNPHMLHLGTIGYGLREFIVMTCIDQMSLNFGKTYIEEAVLNSVDYAKDVFAYCKFIEENALAEDLTRFAEQHKLTNIGDRVNQLIDTGKSNLIWSSKPAGR